MQPRDHYIPQFYLRRWCGVDGRLCRYSMPRDVIVPKRVSPKQTAREAGLYGTMEKTFMMPLDTLAHHALEMLENDDPRLRREAKYRSAWSRFLLSLMMRMPEDLQTLRTSLAEEWSQHSPAIEARYAELKGPTDPETLAGFLQQTGKGQGDWALALAPKLMDHRPLGELINNMRWIVRRLPSEAGGFLTSDRPLLITGDLGETDSYLMIPIGPKLLFAAVHNRETQARIERRDPAELVSAINRLVTGRAKDYVYGSDDSHLDDVRRHFGRRRATSIFERLAEFQRRKRVGETA